MVVSGRPHELGEFFTLLQVRSTVDSQAFMQRDGSDLPNIAMGRFVACVLDFGLVWEIEQLGYVGEDGTVELYR